MRILGRSGRIRRFAVASVLVLLGMGLVQPARVSANSFETIGAGPRASAMLAATGTASGAPAVFCDPAGIVDATDAEISLSFAYTNVHLEINGQNTDEEEISGTMLGLAYPTEVFDRRVALGVLFYLPTQRVSRLLALPLDQPQFLNFGGRNQRMILMAAVALRLTDWLSIGGGVQTLINTFSQPDFTVVQDTNPGNDLTDPAGDAREAQSFGYASVEEKSVLAPLAGIRLGPVGGFQLGLAYRGEVEAKLGAPLLIRIEEVTFPGLDAPIAESRFLLPNFAEVFFSPNEVSGGLAYSTPDGVWTAGLDVTWLEWSQFPPTFAHGLPTFEGGLGQIILPLPSFLPIKPPTRNVVVPSLGVEWQGFRGEAVDLALRGGYSYRPWFVREDRSLTNYLDSTTHTVGAGFGVTIRDWSRFVPKPLSIDGYFQTQVLEEREIRKDDPASSRFGDFRIDGVLLGGGVQATIRF